MSTNPHSFWDDVALARCPSTDRRDAIEALDRLEASIPRPKRCRAKLAQKFREGRTALWMTANWRTLESHEAFDVREIAETLPIDCTRVTKALRDRTAHEVLGIGAFLGILEFLRVGLFELDELASPALNAIGGLCRVVQPVRHQLKVEYLNKPRPLRNGILSIQAGLVLNELVDHPEYRRLATIDWRHPSGVSRDCDANPNLDEWIDQIMNAANSRLQDVPRLAEVAGPLTPDATRQAMVECNGYSEGWVMAREIFGTSMDHADLPFMGVFDPFRWRRSDGDAA